MSRTGRATKWLTLYLLFVVGTASAETPEFTIEIRNHLFEPSELTVPANIKIRLIVHNLDPSPEEFES